MLTNYNMDMRERVVIETNSLAWMPSPLAGVDRLVLEREEAEKGRATSLVRYAPDSHFAPHVHAAGEEFIVLQGVFSDDYGDFGPGMYIRNPAGSRHRPSSKGGCTIFVKLAQMDPEDQEYVRFDTRKAIWQPGLVDGLSIMPLHYYGGERTALVRWAPATRFIAHEHPGGEEIFVLDGAFEDEHGYYPKDTWIRNPPGSSHRPFSAEGCTMFVKTGHLLGDGKPEESVFLAAAAG